MGKPVVGGRKGKGKVGASEGTSESKRGEGPGCGEVRSRRLSETHVSWYILSGLFFYFFYFFFLQAERENTRRGCDVWHGIRALDSIGRRRRKVKGRKALFRAKVSLFFGWVCLRFHALAAAALLFLFFALVTFARRDLVSELK